MPTDADELQRGGCRVGQQAQGEPEAQEGGGGRARGRGEGQLRRDGEQEQVEQGIGERGERQRLVRVAREGIRRDEHQPADQPRARGDEERVEQAGPVRPPGVAADEQDQPAAEQQVAGQVGHLRRDRERGSSWSWGGREGLEDGPDAQRQAPGDDEEPRQHRDRPVAPHPGDLRPDGGESDAQVAPAAGRAVRQQEVGPDRREPERQVPAPWSRILAPAPRRRVAHGSPLTPALSLATRPRPAIRMVAPGTVSPPGYDP